MIRARHLGMAGRYLAHRFRELHPYDVEINLINACNLKCAYCRCPEVRIDLLDTRQWLDIIAGLGRLGALRVRFQGGEPTLRKDFRELTAAVQDAGAACGVTTNGTMIAERADLLDHLDEVVVSLDSARPEAHDRLRGAGSHAKAVRAIERSRAAGRRTFVTAVITRVNLDQLEELVDWCEARELRVHCQPVIFGHQYFDEGARAVALSEEEQRAVHLRLAQWKKQGRRLLFTAEAYAQVAGWGDHDVLSTPWDGTSPSPCMAGKYHVHFEANGDVHPCVLHKATLVPKNAVRDGLEEALRHVQQHDCGDCFTACLVERKLVFGLRPAAVLEALRRD